MTPAPRLRSRSAAILLAAFILVLFGASPAWAHSELGRSDPPNGGMVAVGRSSLTLWFTEAVSGTASSFNLHTADGAKVPVTVTVAPGGEVVEIRTEPLARATYVLDWRVLSLDDGHPFSGQVGFGVGIRPALVASVGRDLPEAPRLMLRWLDLSAIIVAIGALAVSGRVLGSMGEAGNLARRRARFIGALAAGVAVISGAITPFLLAPRGGSSLGVWFDATWATLTDTPWGHLWLGREVSLVIAAVALWGWAIRPGRSPRRVPAAAVALTAAVLLESWAGHASGLPSRSGLAVLVSASHLGAAGVWAGGVIVLALTLIPQMRRDSDLRGPILASAFRAFSPIAAVATAMLLASGLYQSGRHLLDLGSLTSSIYGAAVTAKVALVVVSLTLAAINTLLVNPALAAPVGRLFRRPAGWAPVRLRRFTTVVAAEVLVLAVAVGAGALLTSVPTARETGAATRVAALRTAQVDGLFVTFEEVPTGSDQSRLIVRARSTIKLQPAPVSAVQVHLVGPAGKTATVSLAPVEANRYEGETARPTPGAWKASVSLEREDLTVAVAQLGWTVAAVAPERARPLEVTTTGLALLLLIGAAGAVGFNRRRRRNLVKATPLVGEETLREETVSEKTGSRR